jgi:hypothetical protein
MRKWALGQTLTWLSTLYSIPLIAAPEAVPDAAPTKVPLATTVAPPPAAAPTGAAIPPTSSPPAPQPPATAAPPPAATATSAPPPVQYYAIVPAPVASPPNETENEPKAPPVDPASIHHHGGFYLRLSIGVGYLWNRVEGTNNSEKFTIRGSILPLEVLLGGTALPGLVIGGGLWLNPGLQFKYETDNGTTDLEDDYSLMFAQFGPFVDYYPDPKQGLHFLGAATITNFTLNRRDTFETTTGADREANGFAFTVGVGQEFWIGKQWSAGILGKFTYATLSRSEAGLSYDHEILTPAVLATFTFH